jgi:hypothetical protein
VHARLIDQLVFKARWEESRWSPIGIASLADKIGIISVCIFKSGIGGRDSYSELNLAGMTKFIGKT